MEKAAEIQQPSPSITMRMRMNRECSKKRTGVIILRMTSELYSTCLWNEHCASLLECDIKLELAKHFRYASWFLLQYHVASNNL